VSLPFSKRALMFSMTDELRPVSVRSGCFGGRCAELPVLARERPDLIDPASPWADSGRNGGGALAVEANGEKAPAAAVPAAAAPAPIAAAPAGGKDDVGDCATGDRLGAWAAAGCEGGWKASRVCSGAAGEAAGGVNDVVGGCTACCSGAGPAMALTGRFRRPRTVPTLLATIGGGDYAS
jgi:hypothetical protein